VRIIVIQSPILHRGGSVLTFSLPVSDHTSEARDGDECSVTSSRASVASFLSISGESPALYHLGQGVFRQRNILRDGDNDAELFSVENFSKSTVSLGVTSAMRTIDVPCDSSTTAVGVKSWLQQYVDDAQQLSHGQSGAGNRLGPLGLPLKPL
jgi:hypothetical protein